METENCFVITQCNFRTDIITEIKEILLQKDYATIIAEEMPAYNVDLLDHKILKPMQDSSLVLVLLSPKGADKKDANFNVAFEFGYARGTKKDVILLFDGELEHLPSDIRRDNAISINREDWKEELKRVLTRVKEEKQQGRLAPLPEEIITLLEKGIVENRFDTFSSLLRDFSVFFKISDNELIVRMIKNIFEGPKYNIREGEAIKTLLSALNNIFFYDKGEHSKSLKKFLMKFYLPSILDKSENEEITKSVLSLLIKAEEDCEPSIRVLTNFILDKDEYKRRVLERHTWNFRSDTCLDFCLQFIRALILIKNNRDFHNISDDRMKIIDRMISELTSAIKEKYKES